MPKTTDTPSERMIETLCIAQVMRLFGDSMTFFTPTTVQEASVGYDAAFSGGLGFRELLFQFKRLQFSGGMWGLEVDEAQFQRLKRYKDGQAYYVVALFKTPETLDQATRGTSPGEVLARYAAIEVGQFRLKRKAKRIYFGETVGFPEIAIFDNGSSKTEAVPLRVSELVQRLADGRAGVQVGDTQEDSPMLSRLPKFTAQDWAGVKQAFGSKAQPPTQLRKWR